MKIFNVKVSLLIIMLLYCLGISYINIYVPNDLKMIYGYTAGILFVIIFQ